MLSKQHVKQRRDALMDELDGLIADKYNEYQNFDLTYALMTKEIQTLSYVLEQQYNSATNKLMKITEEIL